MRLRLDEQEQVFARERDTFNAEIATLHERLAMLEAAMAASVRIVEKLLRYSTRQSSQEATPFSSLATGVEATACQTIFRQRFQSSRHCTLLRGKVNSWWQSSCWIMALCLILSSQPWVDRASCPFLQGEGLVRDWTDLIAPFQLQPRRHRLARATSHAPFGGRGNSSPFGAAPASAAQPTFGGFGGLPPAAAPQVASRSLLAASQVPAPSANAQDAPNYLMLTPLHCGVRNIAARGRAIACARRQNSWARVLRAARRRR